MNHPRRPDDPGRNLRRVASRDSGGDACWRTFPFLALLSGLFLIGPSWVRAVSCTAPGDDASEKFRLRYTFGAKFEPPEGRVLHGMGQFEKGNREYLSGLGDDDLHPASMLVFIALGDMPRPWQRRMQSLTAFLERCGREGMIPHVSLELFGEQMDTSVASPSERVGVDHEIALTQKRDASILDVVNAVKRFGRPCFVRIGGEFNGEWNGYHPYRYPEAFRKIVRFFRASHVDNAAFVWCYMPSAEADFAARDARGRYRWYPGPDVVDWFGIDLFSPAEFDLVARNERRGRGSKTLNRTRAFLQMAARVGKPVMIAESSACRLRILPDPALADRAWRAWFGPYFRFIRENRNLVKAFYYINVDWRRIGEYRRQAWSDARVSQNPVLMARYRSELKDPCYLHRGDLHLLKDYDRYRPPARPSKE